MKPGKLQDLKCPRKFGQEVSGANVQLRMSWFRVLFESYELERFFLAGSEGKYFQIVNKID